MINLTESPFLLLSILFYNVSSCAYWVYIYFETEPHYAILTSLSNSQFSMTGIHYYVFYSQFGSSDFEHVKQATRPLSYAPITLCVDFECVLWLHCVWIVNSIFHLVCCIYLNVFIFIFFMIFYLGYTLDVTYTSNLVLILELL